VEDKGKPTWGKRPADRSPWADDMFECNQHGWHNGLVCPDCYDAQAIRVEQESAQLRTQRTPEFIRAERARLLASTNGTQ
jgi:hypothetical protein